MVKFDIIKQNEQMSRGDVMVMKYISTRGNYQPVEAAQAIRLGMVPAGGLFVPEKVPIFSQDTIYNMKDNTYQEIALMVLEEFLSDYQESELEDCIRKAYNEKNFTSDGMAPVLNLNDNIYIMELWHGPTAAFKDMALQLMPHLLLKALQKAEFTKEVVILVATSGDTGKAALEGFKDIPGIRIIVFYPAKGVSKIQEAQMTTTTGSNTYVVAVEGNFDDCQNSVKEIFADRDFNSLISRQGYQFSSANSINWGRLVPQIIYYFAAYASLLRDDVIIKGQKIDITVPTGNFGNILAAYYAYRMGLPIHKFVCASNDNKILTDFLRTGEYNLERDFIKTISPSMDILISSNLERFLFEITGHNTDKINKWYDDLKNKGCFKIDDHTRKKIAGIFVGEYASETETKNTIKKVFRDYNYLVDTHTAVGIRVYQKYRQNLAEDIPVIIDSTANPYKFSKAVLDSLETGISTVNEFAILDTLNKISGQDIHRALKDLNKQEIKHHRNCNTSKIRKEIKDILNIN